MSTIRINKNLSTHKSGHDTSFKTMFLKIKASGDLFFEQNDFDNASTSYLEALQLLTEENSHSIDAKTVNEVRKNSALSSIVLSEYDEECSVFGSSAELLVNAIIDLNALDEDYKETDLLQKCEQRLISLLIQAEAQLKEFNKLDDLKNLCDYVIESFDPLPSNNKNTEIVNYVTDILADLNTSSNMITLSDADTNSARETPTLLSEQDVDQGSSSPAKRNF
jgi:hypothetical protein